jgi:hypothetical protein
MTDEKEVENKGLNLNGWDDKVDGGKQKRVRTYTGT